MITKVREAIKEQKLLTRGDRVLVAVSGGSDSVFLLHSLYELRLEFSLTLIVAHLNHCFRGQEAHEDALFVLEKAVSLGLAAIIEKYDVPGILKREKGSAQDVARRLRYAFLRRAAAGFGAGKIALGHQMEDQAETVLQHLLRGAGMEGLSGMSPCEGMLIRPLLGLRRTEIENYLHQKQLPFREDSSNKKKVYLRNRVRLELFPVLEKYNPAIVPGLARTAGILRDENEFLGSQAEELYKTAVLLEKGSKIIFDVETLKQSGDALLRRVVLKGLLQTGTNPGSIQVQAVVRLLRSGSSGNSLDIGNGLSATLEYGKLVLGPPGEKIGPFEYHLVLPGRTPVAELNRVIKAERLPRSLVQGSPWCGCPPFEAWLDWDVLPRSLVIRSRLPGDRFCPLGSKSMKKVKDFLIDAKIPRDARKRVAILAGEEGRVIWLAGLRLDENFKVTKGTKNILHLVSGPMEQ